MINQHIIDLPKADSSPIQWFNDSDAALPSSTPRSFGRNDSRLPDHPPDQFVSRKVDFEFRREMASTRERDACGLGCVATPRADWRAAVVLSSRSSAAFEGEYADAPANIGSPSPPPPLPPPRHSTSPMIRLARGRCRGSQVHVVRNHRPDVRPFAGQRRQDYNDQDKEPYRSGKSSRVASHRSRCRSHSREGVMQPPRSIRSLPLSMCAPRGGTRRTLSRVSGTSIMLGTIRRDDSGRRVDGSGAESVRGRRTWVGKDDGKEWSLVNFGLRFTGQSRSRDSFHRM